MTAGILRASMLLPTNALEVIRGETLTLELTVTQPDPTGEKKSIPFPLTDAVVYFTVKKYADSRDILIQKVSTNPAQAEVTDALGGVAKIYLVTADTYRLDLGDYEFDVWVGFTAGALAGSNFPVIFPSTLRLIAGVTRLSP